MPRIRSVHPGLLTDEAVMSLTVESPLAPFLFVGLLMQADDHGIFEWKPLTMKARCLPAISADINSIFRALEGVDMIRKFDADGRQFGAIRNFCQWQNPKSPKYVHPMPEDIGVYVRSERKKPVKADDEGGYGPEDAEAEVDQFPQNGEIERGEVSALPLSGEISPQREEGGGKTSKISKPVATLPRPTDEADDAVLAWNAMAARCGLSKVAVLTEKRRKHLRQRLKECGGIVGWGTAIGLVEQSPFLRGEVRDWKADFDFLLQQSSFTKLMEGSYNNRGKPVPARASPNPSAGDMREELLRMSMPQPLDHRAAWPDQRTIGNA